MSAQRAREKWLRLGAILIFSAGCGSTRDAALPAPRPDSSQSSAMDAHAAFYRCVSDMDCVAVAQAGCTSGVRIALNKKFIDAYYAADAKSARPSACASILINDNRIPRCNVETQRCEMAFPHRKP